MFKIDGTSIRLTRGDSLFCEISLTRGGTTYVPVEGDTITFSMKKHCSDAEPLIQKTIPNDTLILHLLPSDTENLAYGEYVYDIQMDYSDGEVDTFIAEASFTIRREVT